MMILKDLVADAIYQQSGYKAPVYSGAIKMDANENPFCLEEPLKRKLMEELKKVELNRYPEAGNPELRARLAKYYGVDQNMVMLGNGSDELIQILCLTMKGKISGVMAPFPTFVMYKIIAVNAGQKVVDVPLDENFDLDLDAMLGKVSAGFPSLIFLSYPNSPTGNLFDQDKIETLIKKAPGLVIVDEAYGAFSGQTLLPLTKKYDNLLILKTLSKLGMASIRLGFLLGHPEIVAELNKVRLPYNINALSQLTANFFLDNIDEFDRQVDDIVHRREELFAGLKKIAGITPHPSRANFIYFSCNFDSDHIYANLAAQGIMVKNLNMPPRMTNCMRVTVGNHQENETFLKALQRVVSGQGA
ncbi:MAG: histidinol-phosphate transaminase [Smithellaceae bacterium]|nr:histidinol-phosphate transaminase [Smithellaceae bacterium]